ncbi:MAG: ATP synthase F0 subunit C [Limnochordia bacterium]|jgi:F-type H+-transporting ATPase subunit c
MLSGFFAVSLTVLVPAIISAISQGWATVAAVTGMSRQPEAASEIRTTLLVALAFMEALTLFCFVVAILIWVKM